MCGVMCDHEHTGCTHRVCIVHGVLFRNHSWHRWPGLGFGRCLQTCPFPAPSPTPAPAPVFGPLIPFQHPSCMTHFTQVLLLLHSRAWWLPHGLALWFHRSFCRSCSRFRSLRDKCRLSWPPLKKKKKRAALSLTAGLLNTLPSRLVPKILPFHLQSVNLNLTLNSEEAFWESTKWPDIFVLY